MEPLHKEQMSFVRSCKKLKRLIAQETDPATLSKLADELARACMAISQHGRAVHRFRRSKPRETDEGDGAQSFGPNGVANFGKLSSGNVGGSDYMGMVGFGGGVGSQGDD